MFTRNSYAFALVLLATLSTATSHSFVDMRNANYSETFTDLQIGSSGFELKVVRTYNSRSLYNGMFGFGWCPDIGTTLKVNADGTLRITECGAGAEIEYKAQTSSSDSRKKMIDQIMTEVRKRNKGRDERYYKNIEFELQRDSSLRDELSQQFNMRAQVQEGARYLAAGRSNDFIEVKGADYIRTLPSGSTQRFNKEGQLLQISDRANNFIRLTYQGGRLTRVTDHKGASLNFQYIPNSKYVAKVTGPAGLEATYKYKGELLVEVQNGWKNKYTYEYDDLYNMTKINYPDKTFVALSYNKERDWVTSFRDRRGCVESYVYSDGPTDPLNHYKSEVVKKCGDRITNRSLFEFWHKVRPDGVRYLSKTRAVRNGVTSETEYHPVFGRPILVTENNLTTRFDYDSNGLMSLRVIGDQRFRYEYDPTCRKVNKVVMTYTPAVLPTPAAQQDQNSTRKPSQAKSAAVKPAQRTIITLLEYDKRTCFPSKASNSLGQSAVMSYDLQGRVRRIVDQSKKEVVISYDSRTGKAATFERPGFGKINFSYKPNGEIDKVTPGQDLTALQVMDVFKQFLDLIGPATTDVTI